MASVFNITGADLTGSNGDTGRTYTIPLSSSTIGLVQVVKNGSTFQQDVNFTYAGSVVTFLQAVFDTEVITITVFTIVDTSIASELKYTSVSDLWKFLGINESVLNYQPGQEPKRETVKAEPVDAGEYWLDQLGVNKDTLVLTRSSDNEALTEGTDYTFDSDTSKVTITSDGETFLTDANLEADYDYNQLGKDLTYNQTVKVLARAESKVNNKCNCVFADQSDEDPCYKKVVNETDRGQGWSRDIYSTQMYPMIDLRTTTNGAYTSGDTQITLTDANGFPLSGTIYIGGNKVTYSNKTGNTLTIPSDTPDIKDAAIVRGEVVEVSNDPEGVAVNYQVLQPDVDYNIDYDTGEIQVHEYYYRYTETSISGYNKPVDGLLERFRSTYFHAYRDIGEEASIPEDIVEVVYMMASRQLVQQTVLKTQISQRTNFTPDSLGFSNVDIDRVIQNYRMARIRNV